MDKIDVKEVRAILTRVYGFKEDFVKRLGNAEITQRFAVIDDAKEALIEAVNKSNDLAYDAERDCFSKEGVRYYFRPHNAPKAPAEDATPLQKLDYKVRLAEYQKDIEGIEVLRVAQLKDYVMERIVTESSGAARIKEMANGSRILSGDVGGVEKEFLWWFRPTMNLSMLTLEPLFPVEVGIAKALSEYSQSFWPKAETLRAAGITGYSDVDRFPMSVKDYLNLKELNAPTSQEMNRDEKTALSSVINNILKKGYNTDEYAKWEHELSEIVNNQEMFKSVAQWLSMARAFDEDGGTEDFDPWSQEKRPNYVAPKRFVRQGEDYNKFIKDVVTDPTQAYRDAIAALRGKHYFKADNTKGDFTEEILAYWIYPFYQNGTIDMTEFIELLKFGDKKTAEDATRLAAKAEYVCTRPKKKEATKPSQSSNKGPSWLNNNPSFR